MVKRSLLVVALVALLVAMPALAQTRETQAKNLEKYSPYIGDPVDRFHFWSMYEWELVGPDKVVVWTTINEAYLITVDQPCSNLEFAKSVGVTSNMHEVYRRSDAVTFRHERCPIKEIRPIDMKRYLAERHGDKNTQAR